MEAVENNILSLWRVVVPDEVLWLRRAKCERCQVRWMFECFYEFDMEMLMSLMLNESRVSIYTLWRNRGKRESSILLNNRFSLLFNRIFELLRAIVLLSPQSLDCAKHGTNVVRGQ
jgi:hypothetical protein